MDARLETAITNIVDIFMQYADSDEGKKNQLSQEELKTLLDSEIKSKEFKEKINAVDIEDAIKLLDKNHDGMVNFREFCRCVSMLAKCYFHAKTGKGGKKGKGKVQDDEAED